MSFKLFCGFFMEQVLSFTLYFNQFTVIVGSVLVFKYILLDIFIIKELRLTNLLYYNKYCFEFFFLGLQF